MPPSVEPQTRDSDAPEVYVQAPEVDHSQTAPQVFDIAEGLHVSDLDLCTKENAY